jgi:hypothetical protein
MFKNLIILITLFMCAQLFAADVLLKAGANNSWFANEGGTSETKPAVGIGVQFPLNNSQKLKLGVDALYVGQKMNLENKSWQGDPFRDCGATIGSLHLHYLYFKLPINLTVNMYKLHHFNYYLSIGISVNFTLKSKSSSEGYHYEDEWCDFDYPAFYSDRQPHYPSEFVIGTGVRYRTFGIELLYNYSIGKTEFLYGLKIQDHIHSIRLMMNWYLKQ